MLTLFYEQSKQTYNARSDSIMITTSIFYSLINSNMTMLTLLQKFVQFIEKIAKFLGLNKSQTSALETFIATNILTLLGFLSDAVTRLIQGQAVDRKPFLIVFGVSIVSAIAKGIYSYAKALVAMIILFSSTNTDQPIPTEIKEETPTIL